MGDLLRKQKDVVIAFAHVFSTLQEFGQSTPEFRKSARKIPTLFKKRRLEKEVSANPAEKKPVRYRAPSPSDKVNGRDNDSDDSATGEYIEVKFNLIPYIFFFVSLNFSYHLQSCK